MSSVKGCLPSKVVHFKCRDSHYIVHLNVGTVPTFCILNVGTVPTFRPSELVHLNDHHYLSLWRDTPQWVRWGWEVHPLEGWWCPWGMSISSRNCHPLNGIDDCDEFWPLWHHWLSTNERRALFVLTSPIEVLRRIWRRNVVLWQRPTPSGPLQKGKIWYFGLLT